MNRQKDIGEVFTPSSMVKTMCNIVPQDDWSNPEKIFLEPTFGNGNFIVEIIERRVNSGILPIQALRTLYGVELMADNVQECHKRVLDLLDRLDVEYNKEEAKKILEHNLVCHDFFTWNLEEWRPMTDEEIKKSRKK